MKGSDDRTLSSMIVGRRIIIILAGLGRCWIVRFRRCKPFTAKDVTEVSCPPVAYQRNVLEKIQCIFPRHGGLDVLHVESWVC